MYSSTAAPTWDWSVDISLVGLRKLGGWNILSGAVRRDDVGSVGGLNDDLEIGIAARGGDVGQGEAVDVALVRDEVEVGVDARFRRVNEAEVADHIHNPEILVAGRGLHDLLGGRDNDEGRVLHLRADGDDVLRVIGHSAGCGLGVQCQTSERSEHDCDCGCLQVLHRWTP